MDVKDDNSLLGWHVHFVGIGGSGMSGLARVLLEAGAKVTGSDAKPNEQTAELIKRGVQISFEQRGELLDPKTGLVVRTAAVRDDNPEMLAAARLRISAIKYAEMLGRVMGERFGVAVAGTHGKSTTSAMLCFALLECGLDPSFVVGGNVRQLGGGSRAGAGPHFVAEACEYDRSFHQLRPRVVVLNNIEAEHLDCYGSLDAVIESFRTFALLTPAADGLVIARGDDENVRRATRNLGRSVQTFGFSVSDDWRIVPTQVVSGCHHGDIWHEGRRVATLRPALPGQHSLLNATCALATAAACGANLEKAAESISRFTGVDRRMTEVGHLNGATLVDDYGHHPTEIRVTLAALRQKYQPSRLVCVFQPHQHSRTRLLLNEFASCFESADLVILPEIYSVRDSAEDRAAVNSAMLVDRINDVAGAGRARHIPTLPSVADHLRATIGPGDLVVSMGAGNVDEIMQQLANNR